MLDSNSSLPRPVQQLQGAEHGVMPAWVSRFHRGKSAHLSRDRTNSVLQIALQHFVGSAGRVPSRKAIWEMVGAPRSPVVAERVERKPAAGGKSQSRWTSLVI